MVSLISVIVPVYNESETLQHFMERLLTAMNDLSKPYEIIITNDGSTDHSFDLLMSYHQQHPHLIKVIDFKGNFGQHMAIIAGFDLAKGDVMITLDADLQNPPEEIHKLVTAFENGFDYVGTYRADRKDTLFRTSISKLMNWVREKTTHIIMKDQGCMLRAYDHTIAKMIVATNKQAVFIPALGYKLSTNPTEIEVQHAPRAFGHSKYNLYSLIRLNFDLITGFSFAPLHLFTMFGMGISFFNGLLVVYLLCRRIIMGPEAEGVFTLFAIVFFLMSVIILGIGLIGEYVGRFTATMTPCYQIRRILKND